jgi:hypothetical protein
MGTEGVEYTDEFELCWESLTEAEQQDVRAVVGLLEAKGPQLPYPIDQQIKELKKEGFLDPLV